MDQRFSVDGVLRSTLGLYGERLGRLLGTAALLYFGALAGMLLFLVIGALLGSLVGLQAAGVGLGIAVGLALVLAAGAAYTGSVIKLVECHQRRVEPGSVMETLAALRPRIWPMVWIQLVVTVLVVCGLLLLLIPGIWLLVIWSVVLPVIVLEGRGFDSLRRSRGLVRGSGWSVFGVGVVYILVLIAINILQLLLQGAFGQAAAGVFAIATSILALPIGALLSSFVYFELVRVSGPDEGGPLPRLDEQMGLTPPPPPPPPPAPPA